MSRKNLSTAMNSQVCSAEPRPAGGPGALSVASTGRWAAASSLILQQVPGPLSRLPVTCVKDAAASWDRGPDTVLAEECRVVTSVFMPVAAAGSRYPLTSSRPLPLGSFSGWVTVSCPCFWLFRVCRDPYRVLLAFPRL